MDYKQFTNLANWPNRYLHKEHPQEVEREKFQQQVIEVSPPRKSKMMFHSDNRGPNVRSDSIAKASQNLDDQIGNLQAIIGIN